MSHVASFRQNAAEALKKSGRRVFLFYFLSSFFLVEEFL